MPTPYDRACWIIGYGNTRRRDDGIGPWIVGRLKDLLRGKERVRLVALPQLTVDLVGELHTADRILFVDATVDDVAGGRSWRKVYPETHSLPYLTHHVRPAYLLGLIQGLYHRSCPAWLVSIQGYDFGFGEGLSPRVEKRLGDVSLELVQFIEKKIDRDKFHRKRYPYRSKPWGIQQTS